jgi:hypothetical protein
LGRPRERRPLFGGVYVLVPIWLGAPRPAWRPDRLIERGPAGFLGRYLVTVDFFPSSTLIKASMLQSIKDVPTIKELHTWIFNLLCFNDAKRISH